MGDSILLPGGLLVEGRLHRQVLWGPLTGAVEMAFAQGARRAVSKPEWVSLVLASAIARVGEVPMSLAVAEAMAVGDRDFLMLELGKRMHGDQIWASACCRACGEHLDLSFQRSTIRIRTATSDFPTSVVTLRGTAIALRAPIGSDQQWLCRLKPENPRLHLLARCVVAVDGQEPAEGFAATLTHEDCHQLESAIEAMGPEIERAIRVDCPECGAEQQIHFDPCCINGTATDLDGEIHTLAFYYHWNEREILDITRERRQRYLALIDRERGCHV